MIDIVDIVNSYAKLFGNKTKKEVLLAEKRYEICLECPQKSSLGICKLCKCVLKAKIFTSNQGTCPLGKWEEVERLYSTKNKNVKTII